MELKEFLDKNNIRPRMETISVCEKGLAIMKKAIDPSHDEEHIFDILDALNSLINSEPFLKDSLDFNIILISIFWHDSWRSRILAKKIIYMIFVQAFEGMGSFFLFKKFAKKDGLPKELISKIAYAIRKHSQFQILPLKTLESVVLADIDGVCEFSLSRLERLADKFLFVKKPNRILLKAGKFYFEKFMKNDNHFKPFFSWTAKEGDRRKKIYFDEVEKAIKKYEYLLVKR
jgi:hypothetical protein